MNCVTLPTTTQCIPCIHPLDYLFELAYVGVNGLNNNSSFAEALDRFLDTGIVMPNCKFCCPECNGIYAFGSVETISFKLFDFFQYTPQFENTYLDCCTNIRASTETYINFLEKINQSEVPNTKLNNSCCDNFDSCLEDLFCWATETTRTPYDVIDRLNDKGIVEYGNILNNCSNDSSSSLCKLLDLFKRYSEFKFSSSSRAEVLDRILDKGIVISCSKEGEIIIASVETWIKYGEAEYPPVIIP